MSDSLVITALVEDEEAFAAWARIVLRPDLQRGRPVTVRKLDAPFDPIAHTGLVTISAGEYERLRSGDVELTAWRNKWFGFYFDAARGRIVTHGEDGEVLG